MKLATVLGLIAALTVSTAQACEHGSLEEYAEKARSGGLVVVVIVGEREIRAAVDYVNAVSVRHIKGDAAVVLIGPRGALMIISFQGCVVGGSIIRKGGTA